MFDIPTSTFSWYNALFYSLRRHTSTLVLTGPIIPLYLLLASAHCKYNFVHLKFWFPWFPCMFLFLRNSTLILLLFMVLALQPLPRLYTPPLRQSEWMKQTTLRWSVVSAVFQLPVCHGPKMAAARCCLSEKFTQFQMWRKVTKENTNVLQIMRRDQTTRRLTWLSKVCGKELRERGSLIVDALCRAHV